MEKDSLYAEYRERIADFVFDRSVVAVFDDMIRRSVPGYAPVIAMTRVFARHYAKPNSILYDLGCSLGASTLAMRKGIEQPGCRIIAVDKSGPMLERCREIIQADLSPVPVDFRLADIADIEITNASMVVLNYTLQFLDPGARDEMVRRIHDGLLPGGVLVLSEKIRLNDPDEDAFQVRMYEDFKRLNGYSELEISQKRKALENVLLPDSLPEHFARLGNAGFNEIHRWFECFNFVSIAAFKS